MGLVRSKDTKPELTVRRLISRMGYRYRLYDSRLPGKPDLVFKGRMKVVFVHGCFWHRHANCALARLPKSRLEFWWPKLEGNKTRDSAKRAQLKNLGWRWLVVWECELRNIERVAKKVERFLETEDSK